MYLWGVTHSLTCMSDKMKVLDWTIDEGLHKNIQILSYGPLVPGPTFMLVNVLYITEHSNVKYV